MLKLPILDDSKQPWNLVCFLIHHIGTQFPYNDFFFPVCSKQPMSVHLFKPSEFLIIKSSSENDPGNYWILKHS